MTTDQRSAENKMLCGPLPTTTAAVPLLGCVDLPPVMCWRWTVPGEPEQARRVRHLAGSLLDGHPSVADILAVASELFANAVHHTASGNPGGRVLLEIRRCQCGLALAVTDQGGPSEPIIRTVGETLDGLAEGGRGLLTVAAYASRWFWRGDSRGRTVTAFFWE